LLGTCDEMRRNAVSTYSPVLAEASRKGTPSSAAK
jgi:hypothetical protein